MSGTDKQFDEYLDGKSNLSEKYAELGDAGPPPELDAAILAEAKRASRMHSHAEPTRRWVVPVSLAATVMICLSLALNVLREAPTGIETEQQIDALIPAEPSPARAPPPVVSGKAIPAVPAEKKESSVQQSLEEAAESPLLLRQVEADSLGRLNKDQLLADGPADEEAVAGGRPMSEVTVTGGAEPESAAVAPLAVSIYRLDEMDSDELSILAQMMDVVTEYRSVDDGDNKARLKELSLPAVDDRAADLAAEQSAYSGLAGLSSTAEQADFSGDDQAVVAEPESELRRIAELYAQGQNTDAAEALAEFREAFPDHPVSRLLVERGY